MTDVARNFPLPWSHGQFEQCLLCGTKKKIGFIGGFTPSSDTADLWTVGLRPGGTNIRFFALCHKHWKAARKTEMGIVDEYFRAQLAAERMGPVH